MVSYNRISLNRSYPSYPPYISHIKPDSLHDAVIVTRPISTPIAVLAFTIAVAECLVIFAVFAVAHGGCLSLNLEVRWLGVHGGTSVYIRSADIYGSVLSLHMIWMMVLTQDISW